MKKLIEMKEKIMLWPLKKKVIAGVISVAVVGACVTGGLVVYNVLSNQDEDVADENVVEKKIAENKVEVPSFSSVTLTSESMEKDLTLYFTPSADSDEKITGIAFSVKLATEEDCSSLNDVLSALSQDKYMIDALASSGISDLKYTQELDKSVKDIIEAHKTDETQDVMTAELASLKEKEDATVDANKANETNETNAVDSETQKDAVTLNAKTGKPLTIGEYYTVEKQKNIKEYAKVLDTVKGNVYSDEDNDGMIHIESIDSGDYNACYIPVNETYDATSYETKVNVKDKIEYKPVADIKKKTVSASAAGDVKPAGAVQEAVNQDTVAYVASTSNVVTEYKEATAAPLNVELSGATSVSYPDATGSVNVSATNIKLYSAEGKNSASITFDDLNGKVTSYEIESQSIDGVTASMSGNSLTVSGNSAADTSGTINIRVNLITESGDSTALSVPINVSLVGSSNVLRTVDEEELYMSNADGAARATVADYHDGQVYYVRSEKTVYTGWQTIDGHRYYYDANGNYITGKQTIQGATYNFGNDGVLLTSGNGIDVSKWQGNINWNEASSAISFAIIRCGFRGSSGNMAVDPKYAQNMKGAKAAGVRVGLYFYSKATNEAMAVEEASLAVQLANEQGGCSLPIYIDMEDGDQAGLSNAERTAIVNAFCNTVKAGGYRAGLYANYHWLTNKIDTGSLSGISIWCARYNTYCGLSYPYDIWQYSSKGSVPGIAGNVDLDTSYF